MWLDKWNKNERQKKKRMAMPTKRTTMTSRKKKKTMELHCNKEMGKWNRKHGASTILMLYLKAKTRENINNMHNKS